MLQAWHTWFRGFSPFPSCRTSLSESVKMDRGYLWGNSQLDLNLGPGMATKGHPQTCPNPNPNPNPVTPPVIGVASMLESKPSPLCEVLNTLDQLSFH